jgi:hypothetical protein
VVLSMFCVEMWHRPGGAELGNATEVSQESKFQYESRLSKRVFEINCRKLLDFFLRYLNALGFSASAMVQNVKGIL